MLPEPQAGRLVLPELRARLGPQVLPGRLVLPEPQALPEPLRQGLLRAPLLPEPPLLALRAR